MEFTTGCEAVVEISRFLLTVVEFSVMEIFRVLLAVVEFLVVEFPACSCLAGVTSGGECVRWRLLIFFACFSVGNSESVAMESASDSSDDSWRCSISQETSLVVATGVSARW